MFVIGCVFVVAVVGAMTYGLAANPLLKELGPLAYHAAMIGLMVSGALGAHEAILKVVR